MGRGTRRPDTPRDHTTRRHETPTQTGQHNEPRHNAGSSPKADSAARAALQGRQSVTLSAHIAPQEPNRRREWYGFGGKRDS